MGYHDNRSLWREIPAGIAALLTLCVIVPILALGNKLFPKEGSHQ